MRIVCPDCDAAYNVPDAMLATGTRKVRCAKCGNEWAPTAAPVEAPPHDDPEVEPVPPIDARPLAEPPALPPLPETDPLGRHEPRLKPLRPRLEPIAEAPAPLPELPPEPGRGRAMAAWALTVLVLVAAVAAAVAWRTDVIATWPPSERLFSAVGLR